MGKGRYDKDDGKMINCPKRNDETLVAEETPRTKAKQSCRSLLSRKENRSKWKRIRGGLRKLEATEDERNMIGAVTRQNGYRCSKLDNSVIRYSDGSTICSSPEYNRQCTH